MILMAGTDRLIGRVFKPETAAQNIEDHHPEPHEPIAFNPFKHDQKQRPPSDQRPPEPPRISLR